MAPRAEEVKFIKNSPQIRLCVFSFRSHLYFSKHTGNLLAGGVPCRGAPLQLQFIEVKVTRDKSFPGFQFMDSDKDNLVM